MSFSRVGTFLRNAKPIFKNNVRRSSGHTSDLSVVLKEHKGTFNDLPVPSGSWQENYSKRNARFNAQLGLSALLFVSTAFFMIQSKVFYLHRIGDVRKININP